MVSLGGKCERQVEWASLLFTFCTLLKHLKADGCPNFHSAFLAATQNTTQLVVVLLLNPLHLHTTEYSSSQLFLGTM